MNARIGDMKKAPRARFFVEKANVKFETILARLRYIQLQPGMEAEEDHVADARVKLKAVRNIQTRWRQFTQYRIQMGEHILGNKHSEYSCEQRSLAIHSVVQVVSVISNLTSDIRVKNDKRTYSIMRYLLAFVLFNVTGWMTAPLGQLERDELNVVRGKYFDEFLMPNDVQIGRHKTNDAFIYAPALNADDTLHLLNVIRAIRMTKSGGVVGRRYLISKL